MKSLFLSFLVSDEEIEQIIKNDINMPIQTHKFGRKIYNIISDSRDVDVVTFLPVSNYPGNKKIFFGYNKHCNKESVRYYLPFINLLLLKHISRFIALVIFFLFRGFKYNDIYVHGVHSPYLLMSYIMRSIRKSRIFVIFTDPPGVIEQNDSLFSTYFKRIDKLLVKKLVLKFNGIVLSEKIHEDYMPNSNVMLLDGIVDDLDIKRDKDSDNTIPQVIYAGLLHEKYGVKLLVDAINSYGNPIILKVFGKGPLESYIKDLNSDKIEFFGYVNSNELVLHYEKADAFINPRPSQSMFTLYSFPSKLLEYMSVGAPVITTKLPSISSDLDEYLNYIVNEDIEGIHEILDEVLINNVESSREKALKGKAFVNMTRTVNAYKIKLTKFLNNLDAI